MNQCIKILGLCVVIVSIGFAGYFIYKEYREKPSPHIPEPQKQKQVDVSGIIKPAYDEFAGTGSKSVFKTLNLGRAYQQSPTMVESEDLGFSVGGAKDVGNFRKNLENGFLPLVTDVTYEGLFYEYYFDTGKTEECKSLFCPSYTYVSSRDPFSGKTDHYLSVGLNSGIKESDFKRKKLNLVVVLDFSGSMSSSFDQYYYDRFGGRQEIQGAKDDVDANKDKMHVAAKSVVALLDHLQPEDRFGFVLFDDTAHLAKPLTLVKDMNMQRVKGDILELQTRGGTNMSAGMKMGEELFKELHNIDKNEYENRIIFLTDAMPNLGEQDDEGLLGLTQNNEKKNIYTSFIGIGVDFNSELVEAISKVRGANYYSVHSSKEFKERMDEGFDFMVTPLVFDLKLALKTKGWKIEKVFGSPEADEATGDIMFVKTLFPSKTKEGKTKGGVVMLKLEKLSDDGKITLEASYTDRSQKQFNNSTNIEMNASKVDAYPHSGIRKAILLTRYAALLKNWLYDERKSYESERGIEKPSVTEVSGIIIPPPLDEGRGILGKWERQSLKLKVSTPYKQLFGMFKSYFDGEAKLIGDETLKLEIEILGKLSN